MSMCVYSYIFPSLCVCDSTLFGQQDTNKYSHSISEGASPELQQEKNSQRDNSKSLKRVRKLVPDKRIEQNVALAADYVFLMLFILFTVFGNLG